jgi:hypothetical protein
MGTRSVEETVESKQRHILARSELRMLSDEVMKLVGILDGINRVGRRSRSREHAGGADVADASGER